MNISHVPAPIKTFAFAVFAMGAFGLNTAAANVNYTAAFDWTAVYDGTVLPLDPGSVQYDDETSGSFQAALDDPNNLNVQLLDGGLLKIDSVNRGVVAIDANQAGRFVLNVDTGYTAEFRARLIRSVNLTTDLMNINGAAFQLNDGRAGVLNTVHLGLFSHPNTGENYARVRAGAFSPAVIIGNVFRIYTFVVTATEVSFYVDGLFVATLPPWVVVDRPEVWLGTFQTNNNHVANFEVDYVKLYDGGAVHPVDIGEWDLSAPIHNLIEPLPDVVGFVEDAGDFALSFKTVLGGNYLVKSRDDLSQPTPNEPVAQVVGTGDVVISRDSMDGVNRRFYQVARGSEEIVYEQSFDWDFRYEGDVDPLASNAIQYNGGTTGAFMPFRSPVGKYRNDDGLLLLQMPFGQAEGGAFDVSTASWDPAFLVNADTGYTLEYRVRVNESLHYGAAVLEINASGGGHHATIGLVTETADIIDETTQEVIGTERRNIARLQSSAGTLVRDFPLGNGFNTLTLLGERNLLTLFINGVEVASTNGVRADLVREFLRFGSATGPANTSRYDVDYIRIYTGGAVRPISPLAE